MNDDVKKWCDWCVDNEVCEVDGYGFLPSSATWNFDYELLLKAVADHNPRAMKLFFKFKAGI